MWLALAWLESELRSEPHRLSPQHHPFAPLVSRSSFGDDGQKEGHVRS